MKSGMQMMFESMLGEQGVKAIEECKRLLPSVPVLIQNIKEEWETIKREQAYQRQLLERIATQNNLILGQLEQIAMKADPIKTTEAPHALLGEIASSNGVIEDATERLATNGVKLCEICGMMYCEHYPSERQEQLSGIHRN